MYLGLEIKNVHTHHNSETYFGVKITDSHEHSIVHAIHPNSPANMLAVNDHILAVNGYSTKMDANKWINHFGLTEIELTVLRNHELIKIKIKPDACLPDRQGKEYYMHYHLHQLETINENQQKLFDYWRTKK